MYKETIRPILDLVGHSEDTHKLVRWAVGQAENSSLGMTALGHIDWGRSSFQSSRLWTEIDGIFMRNPTIEAAGWDKNGVAQRGMYALGLGAVVIGGVLKNPQVGNPKPRQWAWQDMAVNWVGLASDGMDKVDQNLEKYLDDDIPTIINIANNHDVTPSQAPAAFADVAEKLARHACGFEICICPNRTETLDFLDFYVLKDIAQAVLSVADGKPVYLKTWPALAQIQLQNFIRVGKETGLAGYTSANTIVSTEVKAKYNFSRGRNGGFSGNDPEFKAKKLPQIAQIRRELPHITILACGGIDSAEDAFEAVKAGANAWQINTAFRGRGFNVVNQINRGLIPLMNGQGENGIERIYEAVGIEASSYERVA